MQLAPYIARRVLITVLTLWVISMVVFTIMEILPGDVARLVLGQFATPHDIALIRKQLGLDRPLVVRYVDWVTGFVTGHWGNSYRLQIPIAPLVLGRLGNSLLLAGAALVVIVPISIAGGIVAAIRRGKSLDRFITLGGMVGIAIPEFVSSMFLILIFSLWLPLLPASAAIPEGTPPLASLKYLIMPIAALGLVLFGYVARMVRASMIEELRSNYTRTAVLKGLPMRTVIRRHVLRNALLPAITVITNQVSWLVGGLVVVENVFNYPGIGQLLLQAALDKDVPLLETTVMIVAAALMLANLAADILYSVLNPRIRVHSRAG